METDDTGEGTGLGAFVRAMNACGFTVSIHADGRKLRPDDDPERDRAKRRYPPHLNPHPVDDSAVWMSLGRGYWAARHMLNPPPRVYHISPEHRERWRTYMDHPWWARFWEDSAHLAPPHDVHPVLAKRRREEERRQEWIELWKAKTGWTAFTEAAGRTSDSGADQRGPDESGGHVAEPEPGAGEGLGEQ